MNSPTTPSGLLGDTAARNYSRKLKLFNAFAAPELRQAIASLALKPGMRVLDAGCGTGEALAWLAAGVAPGGAVVGMDLATSHVRAARSVTSEDAALVLQANLLEAPMAPASFDLAWSVNVINHLRSPSAGIDALGSLLRPGGRVALGQSSLLPDMYFAWDSRLERLVNEAVRQYYRDRYQLDERDLTAVRALLGLMRKAGLQDVRARTFMIERIAPLQPEDEDYLVEAIFRDTWGSRLEPYLAKNDYEELMGLCDPLHPDFALRRPDFHFLQSFTLVVGTTPVSTGQQW
jgi:SAM-dependent methyltransferase